MKRWYILLMVTRMHWLSSGPTSGTMCQNQRHRIRTDSIHCHQLLWGRQNTINFLARHCSNQQFDVLLASDVVYVADIIQPLMESVQTLLRRDGTFLFAYCSRRNVPVKVDLVRICRH